MNLNVGDKIKLKHYDQWEQKYGMVCNPFESSRNRLYYDRWYTINRVNYGNNTVTVDESIYTFLFSHIGEVKGRDSFDDDLFNI